MRTACSDAPHRTKRRARIALKAASVIPGPPLCRSAAGVYFFIGGGGGGGGGLTTTGGLPDAPFSSCRRFVGERVGSFAMA